MTTAAPRGRYGGKSADERRSERREKLLEAGLQLYGTEGYAAASIERLCESAGLSTRQFYEEFNNRNEVLLALYDRVNERAGALVAEAARQCLAENAGPRELLRRTSAAYVDAAANDPRWAQIAFVVVVGVTPGIEAHRQQQRAVWAAMLNALADEAVSRGWLPEKDFRLTMRAYIGAVNELVQYWCGAEPKPPMTEIVDTLTHLLYSAVSGPEHP